MEEVFFSCIADRVRDIVGQQLEIRKNETRIECSRGDGRGAIEVKSSAHVRHPLFCGLVGPVLLYEQKELQAVLGWCTCPGRFALQLHGREKDNSRS